MKQKDQKRCVIVGGAPIIDYQNLIPYLREDDYLVFCDCGLKHLQRLQEAKGSALVPDLIVGDFDSYQNPELDGIETIVLPVVKDETDTAFAASEGLRRGFKDFLIIGAIGGRMDHSLVNISLLYKLYQAGCQAVLIDDYSEMCIVGKNPVRVEDSYPFFSLLNMFGPSRGITITGAKYNVSGAEIKAAEQYATSNEVTPGQTACITVDEGELLLIKILREQFDL